MTGKKISYLWQGRSLWQKDKRRIIPMTDRVRRLIEYHFAENNNIGMSKRTIERTVKNVADKAGISKPVSPHVLRHTFAVNCLKKGIFTRALQSLLGHDRLVTTEIYLNLSPEDAIREFINKWQVI
jgi:integrase/recombinase XerD